MTGVLKWSIDLGRWSGVRVRVHYFLVVFALAQLLNAAVSVRRPILPTLAWLAVFAAVLALHELGHVLMGKYQDAELDEILLWPLGDFVAPGPARASDSIAVAAAGLATSFVLAIFSALVLAMTGAAMIFNPFGHYSLAAATIDPGAPLFLGEQVAAFRPTWWLGWFGYLNWIVFLANAVIVALPFDAGRILRVALARSSIGVTRDNPYAQWTARGFAGILILVGLVKVIRDPYPVGIILICLAVLIELMVRTESQLIEDGGFFDDGIFGYDFSEGYTSLEGSTAQVRPASENALKRWRRRRSESRLRRRAEREAAEELRLDEILDKLHRLGRAALTDDEQRFLHQVSSKLRARPKVRD